MAYRARGAGNPGGRPLGCGLCDRWRHPAARDRSAHRRRAGQRRRQRRGRGPRRLRRCRRLHRAGPCRGPAAGAGLHAATGVAARGVVLGRLAHAPEPGPGADVPVRPAAARRTDQPPGPRRHHLAGRLAGALPGHAGDDFPRSRVPRRDLQRHRPYREPGIAPLWRQLHAVRDPAAPADGPAAVGLRAPAEGNRASGIVHQPLQGQGHQGAPGAEPRQGAREDGAAGAGARGGRLRLRVPRARFGAEPDDGARRGGLRLRRGRAARDHPAQPGDVDPERPAHRPAWRQRPGQVHAGQDAGRHAGADERHAAAGQGAGDRLFRPAPVGNPARP
ncbi:hypothetical protein D3C81_1273890 [compost metagenome]